MPRNVDLGTPAAIVEKMSRCKTQWLSTLTYIYIYPIQTGAAWLSTHLLADRNFGEYQEIDWFEQFMETSFDSLMFFVRGLGSKQFTSK